MEIEKELDSYKMTLQMFFGECIYDWVFEKGIGENLGRLFLYRTDSDKRKHEFQFDMVKGKMRRKIVAEGRMNNPYVKKHLNKWSKWYGFYDEA